MTDTQKTDGKPVMWDDDRYVKLFKLPGMVTAVYAGYLASQAGVGQSTKDSKQSVLDLACGTGVITAQVQAAFSDRAADSFEIVALDVADAMLATLRKQVEAGGWTNTTLIKGDAQDMKLESDRFDFVLNNFGPMLMQDPSACLRECYRVTKPGGVCGFATWQKIGWANDIQEALASIPGVPAAPSHDEMIRGFGPGAWYEISYVEQELKRHGFVDIEVKAVPHVTSTAGPGLNVMVAAGLGIATGKFWTDEQRKQFAGPALNKTVVEYMKGKHGDEPIQREWIAILATCRKPSE